MTLLEAALMFYENEKEEAVYLGYDTLAGAEKQCEAMNTVARAAGYVEIWKVYPANTGNQYVVTMQDD